MLSHAAAGGGELQAQAWSAERHQHTLEKYIDSTNMQYSLLYWCKWEMAHGEGWGISTLEAKRQCSENAIPLGVGYKAQQRPR